MQPVIVVGAGGHARVLIDALQAQNYSLLGCTDANPTFAQTLFGVPILGLDEVIFQHYPPAEVMLVNALGSTRSMTVRDRIFTQFKAQGYSFLTVVHPMAIVSPHVVLGEGVQIMAGAIVQAGSQIGDNTIINTAAVVDHDCTIGSHCHLATGATLSGGVTIHDRVHIGTRASIIQGITIGQQALVAAGAVVIRDVADQTTVMGVPAKGKDT